MEQKEIYVNKDFTNIEKYGRYCRPKLVELLKALNLDAVYEKAEGNFLWKVKDESYTKVLDLVGGYGTNLFGHNHDELKARILELYRGNTPFTVQGSCRLGAALLSEKLNSYTKDNFITIFTNSGAETTEAALKHAFLKYKKPQFLAIKGGYHGKTLGAIQVTSSYHSPFQKLGIEAVFLDLQDPETWSNAEKIIGNISAMIFEPVLGEGGVKELPAAFADWVIKMRKEHDFSLIVDEIQTGMGRTGAFFAHAKYGIKPDCICLSKSLGGGLVKIGALMIRSKHLEEEFSVTHTSTFGEDDISCFVGLKALEVLEKDQIIDRCVCQGKYFLEQLKKVQSKYPQQIKEVRGKGLMIGVEFYSKENASSNILHMLSIQEYLGYAIAAYLLNKHNIRIAPTLSQPCTLRIAPSAYIEKVDIDKFIHALEDVCEILKEEDPIKLTCPTNEFVDEAIGFVKPNFTTRRDLAKTPSKVAFIGHMIEAENAILWDSALKRIRPNALEDFLAKSSKVLGPTVYDEINVKSITGDEVHLNFIGLTITSKQMVNAIKRRKFKWIVNFIEEAVHIAKDRGCQVVGFGGYTSIITRNCLNLENPGIGFTTGNSFTVGMGIRAIEHAAKAKGINLEESSLAVIGGTGNIASVYSMMIAPNVKEVVLLVRRLATPVLEKLMAKLKEKAPNTIIRATDNMDDIKGSEIILAASNTREPLIYPRHLKNGPVIICDIALPYDVAPEVSQERPDVLVLKGGIVELPDIAGNRNFKVRGIPLEYGHAFACMSETLLMGLEKMTTNGSYGSLNPDQVKNILRVGDKHGFQLAKYKTDRSF